jgi:hypothetical protein
VPVLADADVAAESVAAQRIAEAAPIVGNVLSPDMRRGMPGLSIRMWWWTSRRTIA